LRTPDTGRCGAASRLDTHASSRCLRRLESVSAAERIPQELQKCIDTSLRYGDNGEAERGRRQVGVAPADRRRCGNRGPPTGGEQADAVVSANGQKRLAFEEFDGADA